VRAIHAHGEHGCDGELGDEGRTGNAFGNGLGPAGTTEKFVLGQPEL
jgi:hypothetical protein